MGDAALRQIVMLQLLPRRSPGVTSIELRSRLADRGYPMHLRSIQRDLDRLSAQFGFTNDGQTPARWFWPPGSAVLSIPSQDPHSALTWRLIEQYLEPLLPPALKREAAGQFDAAREVLKMASGGRFERLQTRVRLLSRSLPLTPPDISPSVAEDVYTALLNGQQLRVRYRARGASEAKDFRVHPLGLVIRDSVYYLVATVNEYDDVIQIALHRIHSSEVLSAQAVESSDFDLDRYITEGGFLYTDGKAIQLVARFHTYTAQHLHESTLALGQTLTDLPDGRVELRAKVLHSQQLEWWLMGFGDKVEVIRPAALRRRLAEQFKTLYQRYQD